MGRKRSKRENQILDILDSLTDLGVKLGGAIFLLVAGYLIYALLSPHGFGELSSMPRPDRLKVVGVVQLMCRVLWASGSVCAICLSIRYYVEEALGYVISLFAVALYLGTPFLLGMRFPAQVLGSNAAIAIITGAVRDLGMTIFAPGLILVIRNVVMRIVRVIAGRREKPKPKLDSNFVVGYEQDVEKEDYKPRAYSQCWQMPYCRKFVRMGCPVYLARRPCWRLKKGCMCDGDIIMKALAAQSGEGSLFHKELQYRMGEVPTQTKLTNWQKRMRCRMCIIYDFHQTQKYKLISPAIFPLVIFGMWFLYPTIQRMLENAIASTDRFMKVVSFMPHGDLQTSNIGMDTPHFVYVVFVVWLGLMMISYALRFVEYCIFTLQL